MSDDATDYLDRLCDFAVKHNAEDLFFKAGESAHLRIDGEIQSIDEYKLTNGDLGEFWERCGQDPSTVQDHDMSWASNDGHRFRVNLFKQLGRLGAALRPIKTDILPLENTGAPADRLKDWCARPSGIVIVTGGTGSGKSTTLAACLEWINQTFPKHIVSIEDPIEYLLKSNRCVVTQREVGSDTPSFLTGMRSALRQSPDVILIGEIRDVETARIALQAAETGHLVLTTLHCSDVTETVERLVALFPADEREAAMIVLSKQIIGFLCQQLLANATGGLHLVCEHLENSGAVKKWLRAGDTTKIAEFMERDTDAQNWLFIQSIVYAFRQGLLTEEVARAACKDPNQFDRIKLGVTGGAR
ncbi:MAG: pilus retraction protein PilT [Verrucomicrobiales bacterium]|jgi:pilus retraction protein PilT